MQRIMAMQVAGHRMEGSGSLAHAEIMNTLDRPPKAGGIDRVVVGYLVDVGTQGSGLSVPAKHTMQDAGGCADLNIFQQTHRPGTDGNIAPDSACCLAC